MRSDQKMKLAENLERLLNAKNLTITSVANRVGMNKSTLHNYCNGVVPRNITKIKELAELFDISLDELIFGEVNRVRNRDSSIEGRFEVVIQRIEKR